MPWFIFSTLGYLFIAVQTIVDKFLLTSKKVSHPAVYTFYSGLLSLVTLVLFPFGFHLVSIYEFILSLAAGVIFAGGALSLFFAIQKHEASRVVPAMGAVIPIATYLISPFVLSENLSAPRTLGVIFLIFGGLLISYKLNPKTNKVKRIFGGFWPSVLAGFLVATAYVIFKYLYLEDSFINVFIWTRLGFAAGSLGLLAISSWRKVILRSFAEFKKYRGQNASSGSLFILAKAIGGVGSILVQYAMAVGNVTVINALVALEYIFIFIMGVSLSPLKVFQEEKDWLTIFQKIGAMIIIAGGVCLVY